MGRAEVRNGFIEVYDSNWQQLGRLLAGDGATAETIDAQFPGFLEAWDAVKDFLPSDFKPADPADALQFSIGQWDDILVYNNNEMIGRVDIWTRDDTKIKFRDGDEYAGKIAVFLQFNDADWNNIARYETEVDKLTQKTVGVCRSRNENLGLLIKLLSSLFNLP